MNRDPREFALVALLGLTLVLAGGYLALTTGDGPTANGVAGTPNATETPAPESTPTERRTADATPTETQPPENEFEPQVQELEGVDVPDGYHIGVFADFEELGGQMREPHGGANPGVRFMHWRNGVLYAAVPGGSSIYDSQNDTGRVVALEDTDDDGRADTFDVILRGLNKPNNLDFHDGYVYVAANDAVRRYEMDGRDVNESSGEAVVEFPNADSYDAPTVTVLANDRGLWVRRSTAIATDPDLNTTFDAAIARCELDGANCTTHAEGLRNAVGMTFSPGGSLVVSEMGAGHATRDYPPDEINVVREGEHYGWPYCHGDNDPVTPEFARREGDKLEALAQLLEETNVDCSNKTAPEVLLKPHMAPLGVTFYESEGGMPERFDGDLLVASHGSWGLDPPIGYEIARVDWDGNRSVHDFVTGWKNETDYQNPDGRPVDITVGPNGAIYISDDKEGRIYVVWHDDMVAGTDRERIKPD